MKHSFPHHLRMRPTSRLWRPMSMLAIVAVLLCGTAVAAYPGNPAWEMVSQRHDPDDPDRIETTSRDGYIYVCCSRTVTVRLYSILGQLISQQTLAPGTTRFKVGGRGVYILKIGSVTRRITV